METTAIIAAVDAAITIIEKLAPSLKAAFSKGEISVEDQQVLMDRLNKLRGKTAFTGPEWES